jgi:penicillin V acylase-like amidase (Ntn superfamily)
MKRIGKIRRLFIIVGLISFSISDAFSCTRVLFTPNESNIFVGRTMDWKEDMRSDLWIMPRGLARDGRLGDNPVKWTAKFGSVVSSSYDISGTDGMNEKGLAMNMLYLAESDYGAFKNDRKSISIFLWGQYMLDNFATVKEAVEAMNKDPLYIVSPNLPDGTPTTVHLAISDSSGDSAIFEYIDGKLRVFHSRDYKVMTNSPTYDKQMAINNYWKEIEETFLPGTSRASDRFVRASFYSSNLETKLDQRYISSWPKDKRTFSNQMFAEILSVMRSMSTPISLSQGSVVNDTNTIWRTISDQSNLIYYFDSATKPNIFWVSLSKIDFDKESRTKRLYSTEKFFAGDITDKFVEAEKDLYA